MLQTLDPVTNLCRAEMGVLASSRYGKVDLAIWRRPVGPSGRSFAAAIPTAEFVSIEATGHFPQLEQHEAVLAAITAFAARVR